MSCPVPHQRPAHPAAYYTVRMSKHLPIASEFATTEKAEAYDAWLRTKVQKAINSTPSSVQHVQI